MMTEQEVAEARKTNPFFRNAAGEEQRRCLYPDTFPSERPVIDMIQPCWWVEREAERSLTIAYREVSWRHWLAIEDRRRIKHRIFWEGPSRELLDQLAYAERRCREDREELSWRRILLWHHISQHGSVIDNGSVRTVHPPKEGRDVFAYYEI